jgi:hypothetical protein
MDNGFFGGVETQEVAISTGKRISLPVKFLDWTGTMAHFPAPAAGLRRLLPSKKLKPALLAPGTGILSVMTMEYRQTADVEPYNEVAIMVPVMYDPLINPPGLPLLFHQRFERFGFYIHHLPVTTQEAFDYGVEIWGYPKFVAEITFDEDDRERRCHWRSDGRHVLTLTVSRRAGKPRTMYSTNYTVKDGQLLKTPLKMQMECAISRFRGGASLVLGDHLIADELRALNPGQKPAEVYYAPSMQSMLYPASKRLPL